MSVDKIIEGLILKLTGDNDKDVKFLMSECERYKTHEYANEILRAISRLIYDILPVDEKENINQVSDNRYIGINKKNEEINIQIVKKNFDKALLLIKSVIKNIEDTGWYLNDDKNEYFCFNNLLEKLIYIDTFKPEKEVMQIPENYAEMYFKCGNVLFEIEEYDNAKIVLEKAICYNPVNTEYLFELGEVYKVKKDWDMVLKINKDCLKYAYTNKSIARCYRNLGYYYVEEEKYEYAIALFNLSINYDKEGMVAYSELYYISNKTGLDIKFPAPQIIKKILEENNIQIGANKSVLDLAYTIGFNAQKNNQVEAAKYYYNIIYELTNSNEIKKILDNM